MKVSVWYNRCGIDENYGEIECREFSDDCLRELEEITFLVEGLSVDEFEVEKEGEGWVMYGYDGIGLFVVEDGYDMEKCKREYDDWFRS